MAGSKPYPVSNYREYTPTRNPYGAKIREFAAPPGLIPTVIADQETERFRGRWRERFGRGPEARLELELGAYHGETSHHLARNNPEAIHLGVEWKYKQAFVAGKKALDQRLSNVTFLRANNARLPWMFAPGEIDRVWILFPDPWGKLSQSKWRLLQPGFFRLLANLLPEGRELMIKTDHPDYAAFIRDALDAAGCFDALSAERAAANWSLIPPTPFERIFLRQGLPIHSFALARNTKVVAPPEEVQHVLSSG